MRSSSIFLIFGGLLIAILLFTGLSRHSTDMHPVMKTVSTFLNAVNARDSTAIREALDLSLAKPTWVGSGDSTKLVSLNFPDYTPPNSGPFVKLKAQQWTRNQLAALIVDNTVENPVMNSANLASVIMADGSRMYLHLVGMDWKIFYITRKTETQ